MLAKYKGFVFIFINLNALNHDYGSPKDTNETTTPNKIQYKFIDSNHS